MPKVFSHRIVKGGSEYELAIDFKDVAIMDNRVEFDVVARRRHSSASPWEEVTVTIRFEFEEGIARVMHEGIEIAQIDLLDIPEDLPAEQAWEMLREAWHGSPIEEAIQMVPADPVIGCLLKAGISTTVGQAMRCYEKASGVGPRRRRIRETIRCLGENTLRMILTATARTLRCMVLLGLG